jgi:hypothetical protein
MQSMSKDVTGSAKHTRTVVNGVGSSQLCQRHHPRWKQGPLHTKATQVIRQPAAVIIAAAQRRPRKAAALLLAALRQTPL